MILVLLCLLGAGLMLWFAAAKPGPATPGSADVPRAAITPDGTAPAPGADATATIDNVLNATENLKREGKFAEADALLRECIRRHADEQALYVQHAQVLTSLRKAPDAYDAYVKALATGPRDADLEMAAGTAANAAGKPDRAAEHYAAAQSKNPGDWQAPLYLAQVQIKLKQTAEAKKNLLLSSHLKPDVAITWGTLAQLALDDNASNLALEHVAKARALEPDATLWRLIEGRALKRVGKPEEALLLLVGLDDTAKLEPGVLPLMGECYGLLRRPVDAARLYATFADRLGDRADLAYEAALWFERAKLPDEARTYARRALYLGNQDAARLAGEDPGAK